MWHFSGKGGWGVSKNVTGQFLLVISLVKVDKTCHMGGLKSAEKVSRIIWMAPYSHTSIFLVLYDSSTFIPKVYIFCTF